MNTDMSDNRPWKPRGPTMQIIEAAGAVLAEAEASGHRLTLRRVFYVLVTRGLLPNTERSYKNLSNQLKRARLAGLLPLDCLDDLGRLVAIRPSWETPRACAEAAAEQYRSDWWADADPVVEVWAEKAAVAGIVQPVAMSYGVPFLACRGFSSLTALAEGADRLIGRRVVVVYLGDHDPSGVDMDRDLQERMVVLGAAVELRRLALTTAQIEQHQLPPQPTKAGDSRTAKYAADHDGSWELDALPVPELVELVDSALAALLPFDFADRRAADDVERARLRTVARAIC